DRRIFRLLREARYGRSRLAALSDDHRQLALWLQPLHPERQYEPRRPWLRSDVSGLPDLLRQPDTDRSRALPALRHQRLPGHGLRWRTEADRHPFADFHGQPYAGRALLQVRSGIPLLSRDG